MYLDVVIDDRQDFKDSVSNEVEAIITLHTLLLKDDEFEKDIKLNAMYFLNRYLDALHRAIRESFLDEQRAKDE